MHPQQHTSNGLARLAEESMLARDRQQDGQRDTGTLLVDT